jgi:SHS2 domain-containing protein
MAKFEIVDHTADVGIISYGSTLKEAFANMAYGMFSLIADLEKVAEELCYEVEVNTSDQEALLVCWLNELLYLYGVENVIFKRFEIESLEERSLQAKVYGEKVDFSKYEILTEVKAATYHELKIEKENGFKAQVIFDI